MRERSFDRHNFFNALFLPGSKGNKTTSMKVASQKVGQLNIEMKNEIQNRQLWWNLRRETYLICILRWKNDSSDESFVANYT